MKSTSWLELGLSTLLFTLLFAWYSWPLAAHFTTAFPGISGHDANQYVWNAYNFRQAVAEGSNPFFTSLLLYPQGTSLVMHTYTPVIGLLNVLLRHEILAVNVALLLSFVLSGVGAYRLCRRWVQNPVLCAVAGLVFAFSPYKLAHFPEHYNLLLTATVPFYVQAFLNAFAFRAGQLWPQVRSWGQVSLCVALGLLTLLSDYYVLMGLVYFSAGFALYYGLRLGQINWRQRRPWLLLGVVLVLGHVASRLLKSAKVFDNDGFWWSGDVAGYLLPPLNSRWLSTGTTEALHHNEHVFNTPASIENVMFLGYALPLLALWWLVRLRRQPVSTEPHAARSEPALAWLLLLFIMLTLPELRVFGKQVLRLPTSLVHYLPLLNNIRVPTRFVLFVSLLLPVVLFPGLDAWLRGHLRPVWRLTASVGLLVIIVLEFQPTPPPLLHLASVPRVYRIAAGLPGETLFTIPVGLVDGYRQKGQFNTDELFYQTIHRKKLPGAYISRVTQDRFDAFGREGVLRDVLALQQRPDTALAEPKPAAIKDFLRVYQPAAFVVAPAFRNTPAHLYLRRILTPLGYREQTVDDYVLLAR